MPIDFRNLNMLWASILVETLSRLGLTTAIACPGSRSTPLTVAFAQHDRIETIPILDERSAAFFALGLAKRTGLPTALICTSGTAGANFYPAVIEAAESRVPLLIFTSDRPPELRHTHAGQTINQVNLYGTYPKWQTELALPDVNRLNYLRQMINYGWERSLSPIPGPVHFNIPLRPPLAPTLQLDLEISETDFDPEDYFSFLQFQELPSNKIKFGSWFQSLQVTRGLIIAGVDSPQNPQTYVQAIAKLSGCLKFPILAEGLSPVRNFADTHPYLISTYDLILRHSEDAKNLVPEVIIQIGDFPTSKVLRTWLESYHPRHWIIDPTYQNLDPLHNKTQFLRASIQQLSANLEETEIRGDDRYLQQWIMLEDRARLQCDRIFAETTTLVEPKIARSLSQILPPQTPIFISNSMPVRDVEWFWRPNDRQLQPYFNRGTNGIDGILSTALGIAHCNRPSVLLTGDLSLLHDTNGFLIRRYVRGHLTIILINNNGGGIFQFLPISEYDPPFEEFFAVPQAVDFAKLCQTYDIEYHLIQDWQQFQADLSHLPEFGIRVLEVRCDRKFDAQWRKQLFSSVASILMSPKLSDKSE
ncbi:2-succinyl-5-enolpyruvyl-6-hydroxy-3-cyclohexene-1-carboxylic-acid synthase [Roseofilum casamattae]|uniref:2-succinyl-5-enolpyruvyl-6-hydroxy-3-cyclohexene-1-carboxylate synthase n=1 Tax=Roseofilum casamattae BLCC-M143 TaxID=3022442 RepID=A0ABT7C0N5_9CYAN|nr:2-succinyl-5-enolpyruvyl-6-hydroxy-3-cyclohexene-1-carboxylic-acid synthase [Roseofilum casamattae]MDJ1184073.1 2-succinyl-5-enolpyruvyl-6-hydroxy-3-cyclohexene-1-carboxylic-acid synthase [Roseofilum casamattae BLCC-M143]